MHLVRGLPHPFILPEIVTEDYAHLVQNQVRTNHIGHIPQMHVHSFQQNPPHAFEHSECSLNAHARRALDKIPVVLFPRESVFVALKQSQHLGTA